MTPRNPSSKNWTALPVEFREKAASVLAQNFRDESRHGEFFLDGRIYPEEIIVRAGYVEKGRLKQTNFEVSLDHAPNQSAMEKLFMGIDVLGSVFETHFEHLREEEVDDVEYPVNWEEFDFDDGKVYLRFSTTNTRLEEEANRLLGLGSDDLYMDGDEDLSADALEHAMIDSDLAAEVSKAIRDGRYTPKLSEEQMESLEKSEDQPLH
ncbi:MAG: hypothetical protein RBT63_01750 [Bdellovibrionales bacterium]|jgi:hypothetical protein|nr:hypothetical protein [Bdellovibrionales bacterium]